MKIKILSIVLLFAVMSGFTKSTYAATVNNADYTLLGDIKAINKIEVRGNVELFISDNSAEQVKVYNKYYSENALVQYKNGLLRISSYSPEKLIVWVSSDDLYAVSVYDNAEVKSFGTLSKIEFNVDVHNNASVKLSLDAYSANITVNDHAKAELSGSAKEFSLNHAVNTSVIKTDFIAEKFNDHQTGSSKAIKADELSVLE